ncbi:hypothetical protein OPQ81_005787 [Rhizoctonia solani]|nr:hypothetical protein OPQ81_005787 [Rhizoctonia solani]
MIRVPNPPTANYTSEMPFLDIAGKRLSIVVLPPQQDYILGSRFECQHKITNDERDGVKVINGKLIWTAKKDGKSYERGIAVDPQKAESMVLDAKDNIVTAGPNGAIFIHLAPSKDNPWNGENFTEIGQVKAVNCFPDSHAVDPTVCDLEFPWVPCNARTWAQCRSTQFHNSFHNLVGFHVVYDDDSLTSICHIQAWTLGIYQSAEFHNHNDKAFCEIHACIVNGTGTGGMWWARDDRTDSDNYLSGHRGELNQDNLEKYAKSLYVKSMEEHGPLWHIHTNSEGKRYPKFRDDGTVDYPYHAWLAGPWPRPNSKRTDEAYDVWLAFEFPPSEIPVGRVSS